MFEDPVEKILKERYEKFYEKLIEESKVIEVAKINRNAFQEADEVLDNRGFDKEGRKVLYNGMRQLYILGCPRFNDNFLPDDHAIVIQDRAIYPTPTSVMPCCILSPEGIVTLVEKDNGTS